MDAPFPTPEVEVTLLRVVGDVERARTWYRDVLGATDHRQYGGTSAVMQLQGLWLLLVTGGEPTDDKPTVTFAAPEDPDTVAHELTLRVPDCMAAYEALRARGAEFLAPPSTSAWEIRAFFRDPDGHLLEISERR